jgi:hypothetical protein
MTADLLALDEWLRSLEIVHIALESTRVFWHPVYNLLEEGRTIVLVNPQQKSYQDLGGDYFAKLDTSRQERHHVRQSEQLGYTVALTPKEAA